MGRPTETQKHLIDKYHELVWALSFQDYSFEDIGKIMNRHRSVIKRVCAGMPEGWKPKWVKVQ